MIAKIQSASLTDRMLDSFPAGTYCIPALLSLTSIEETTDVPTACVDCCARPRLRINPEFVQAHAATSEKLLMLVLHELHHIILGHTRLYPRITPIDNLVFDAVINSMLCAMFPEHPYTSLFTEFYSDRKFPECFLRPPSNWSPRKPVSIPPALRNATYKLQWLYQRLYSADGATYQELRDAFQDKAAACQALSGRLLGDHRPEGAGASSAGDLESRSPELLQEIRRIVEHWPQLPNPIKGRSLSDFLRIERIKLVQQSETSELIALFRKIARERNRSGFPVRVHDATIVDTPVPYADRRCTVLSALGSPPLMYRREVLLPKVRAERDRVHVYMDVSGSMNVQLPSLFAALCACANFVHPVVHQFSTVVKDVSIRDMRNGKVASTGGTCISCVIEHMQENDIRRAVFVTDGYVGSPSVSQEIYLKSCTVGVALTPTNCRAFLQGIAQNWITLKGTK